MSRIPYGGWYHKRTDQWHPVGGYGHFERAGELEEKVRQDGSDVVLDDGSKMYFANWMYLQDYVSVRLPSTAFSIDSGVGLVGLRGNMVAATRKVLQEYPITASVKWIVSFYENGDYQSSEYQPEQIARIDKYGRLPK